MMTDQNKLNKPNLSVFQEERNSTASCDSSLNIILFGYLFYTVTSRSNTTVLPKRIKILQKCLPCSIQYGDWSIYHIWT